MIRYLLYPGYVFSRFDGQRHFITAPQLARLYKVSLMECHIVHADQDLRGFRHEGLIKLVPRYSGNYQRPEAPCKP